MTTHNGFTVLSGAIEVEERRPDGGISYVKVEAGGTYVVPSSVFHRFYVVRPGWMVEEYDRSVESVYRDIDRVEEGSPDWPHLRK